MLTKDALTEMVLRLETRVAEQDEVIAILNKELYDFQCETNKLFVATVKELQGLRENQEKFPSWRL